MLFYSPRVKMNFLAHIYLSGSDINHIAGNFFGDFVKGGDLSRFSVKIQEGIKLHREIDRFTDTHSIVREGKSRLWDEFRHYSGVLIDMYYDHFLAKNWDDYSNVDLLTFTEQFYEKIETKKALFSDEAQIILGRMRNLNWLYQYASLEGMERAFEGISRKASFESGMEKAGKTLKAHYNLYEDEFQSFFPDVIRHSQQFLENLSEK